MTIKIIDVSAHQQRIEWEKVAADCVKGVILRTSRGHYYGDTAYAYNATKAKEAGLLVGSYHYFDPAEDPIWQAEVYYHAIRAMNLPPVLDLEHTGGMAGRTIYNKAREFVDKLERLARCDAMLYTRAYWFNRHVAPYGSYFNKMILWVAHYTTRPQPYIPKGFETWDLWQYSKNGSLNGIKGSADLNRMNPNGRLAIYFEGSGGTVATRDNPPNSSL